MRQMIDRQILYYFLSSLASGFIQGVSRRRNPQNHFNGFTGQRGEKTKFLGFLLIAGLVFCSCRGDVSSKPPLTGIRNMEQQPRYDPQESSPLFGDRRSSRMPEPGTVAREGPRFDPVLNHGKNADGSWVDRNPTPITLERLVHGQRRYNIFCAPCHDRAGTGRGLVVPPRYQGQAGFPPPPSFHDGRIRAMADGQLFDAITHGVRTMPAYRRQIPEDDRWAIIAYLRALERSQQTTIKDIPADQKRELDGMP